MVGQELDPQKMYKMCQQKSNATDGKFLKSVYKASFVIDTSKALSGGSWQRPLSDMGEHNWTGVNVD